MCVQFKVMKGLFVCVHGKKTCYVSTLCLQGKKRVTCVQGKKHITSGLCVYNVRNVLRHLFLQYRTCA